nr:hypothetical protein Cplu_474 [Cedratvirus plubellavi]
MEQQNQIEKNEMMTRVARCPILVWLMITVVSLKRDTFQSYCNLNRRSFNEIACYNSLVLAESCIKKIYKQSKDT